MFIGAQVTMFIILMLFNNVQGILSLFNLKRLKCFDLPKFPKAMWKVNREYELRKKKKTGHSVLGWPKSSFRLVHTVYWKSLNELFGQPNSLSPKIGCQCLVLLWNLWELPHLPSCHPQDEAQGAWNGGQGLSQLGQVYPSASSPISIYPSNSSHTALLCVI